MYIEVFPEFCFIFVTCSRKTVHGDGRKHTLFVFFIIKVLF